MLINSYNLEVKKSKFIAYYYSISSEIEIKNILEELRKEHKNAKHIPYAYKLGNVIKKSEDKEPNGTAGLQLYNLINIYNLNNTLLVVVRYFGGTKLGVGPLSRAYKNASIKAIKG